MLIIQYMPPNQLWLTPTIRSSVQYCPFETKTASDASLTSERKATLLTHPTFPPTPT